MDPTRDGALPDADVLIRPAQLADVEGIVQVHVASTEDSYAPLARAWPAVDWQQRRAHWAELVTAGLESSTQRVDVVAELAGKVVGFASGGVAREPAHGAEVELYVIHVSPDHRARGVGSLLWSETCRRLRGAGLRSMYVSTLAELRCCSFYQQKGGVELSRRPRPFHGAERTEVIYLWAAGRSSRPVAAPAR